MLHRVILQRLVSNLKNRRWSDLGLELVVVVVGIFLGLQADDWYRARAEQQQLATYLQAVSNELETTASLRRGYIAWHERVIDGLVKALEGLEGTVPTGDDLKLAHFGLAKIGSPPTSPQRHVVLNAMQAEGMLRLIDDPELVQVLGEIGKSTVSEYAEYERHVASNDAPPFSPELIRYELDEERDVVIASVDWAAAMGDPAFRQRVLQGIRTYQSLLRGHKASLAINGQALEMLARLGFEPSSNWLAENQEKLGN